MSPTLWRASLRHLRHHPWQLSLAILGVGLGVAIMVAIDLASGSALRAFELSSSAVLGKATHTIEGGAVGISEEIYRRLRTELGVRSVAPIVESFVVPARKPEMALRLHRTQCFAETLPQVLHYCCCGPFGCLCIVMHPTPTTRPFQS